ncbi:MAG: family 16 glycosylhydrolase [Alteromonadales bacterium]|nr:family 16 glycosylhydrolase [Alteromonadales bacterium]
MFYLKVLFVLFCLTSMSAKSDIEIEDPLHKFNDRHWWFADGWENGFPFINDWSADSISYSQNAMLITLKFNKPTLAGATHDITSGELRSKDYFSYGCFEIEMKPVSTSGVITSFFLFAGPDDKPKDGNGVHNEIDIEFLGVNTRLVQMNYWTDDDLYENSHETVVFLDFDASKDFHHYAISWEIDKIEWFIDNRSVLKIMNNPQDPTPKASRSKLRVMANLWATDPKLKNWAGKLKLDSDKNIVAKYRHFKYSPRVRCGDIL